MIISTSTGMCTYILREKELHYTCEDSIRAIAEAGYQGVDLCFVTYGHGTRPMTRPDWREWVARQRDLALSLGLVINQGHAHFYPSKDSYHFTPLDWEEHEGYIRRDIEAAGMCRIPWLVIHPNSYLENGWFARKKTLAKERERFLQFGELASRYGVGIAIENMIASAPIARFCGGHEDLLELLDLLGDDSLFGICWDIGHANINQIDQPAAIRAMGKRLRALHVNDNYGLKDDHTLPFVGTVQWEPLMKALGESGYSGDFTYECHKFLHGFDAGFHPEAMVFARKTAEHLLTLM